MQQNQLVENLHEFLNPGAKGRGPQGDTRQTFPVMVGKFQLPPQASLPVPSHGLTFSTALSSSDRQRLTQHLREKEALGKPEPTRPHASTTLPRERLKQRTDDPKASGDEGNWATQPPGNQSGGFLKLNTDIYPREMKTYIHIKKNSVGECLQQLHS